jgi:hypothetical protein
VTNFPRANDDIIQEIINEEDEKQVSPVAKKNTSTNAF